MIGAMTFKSAIRMKAMAIRNPRRYARRGSFPGPYPVPKVLNAGKSLSLHTAWKVLGPPTRLARAEDKVEAKIPAVTMGPQPETFIMT